ncbi:retrovirus-related pol polyprotein from transposon TNT 1-94 [Tanacetum coccineum]
MKVEESLNVTFDESPPPTKLSPLVDYDVGEEEAIESNSKVVNNNNIDDELIEVEEVVNIKESKNHPLEQVIGNLNQRTLRSQAQKQMPLPKNQSVIGTKWVYRNKLDENGIVSRNKARLVAQGYNQQEGIDYDETYAPVARLESIRILLAIACANDFKLYQLGVKSAFLNSFINEEVNMDNLDITMEEYIRLEEEKAQRPGQEFNWETATYSKVSYFDDIDYFKEFETDFPAIVFNDVVTTDHKISSEPTIELEKDDPSQECQEGIGEYGLMINDEDYEYMCDYLLAKDAPSFMDDMDERFEEKKPSLIGTPSERIASLYNKFNSWAMANRFVKTSDNDIVELLADTAYPTPIDTAY